MKKIFLKIVLTISMVTYCLSGNAQFSNCSYDEKFLAQFGPWICPEYLARLNDIGQMLPEVVVTAPRLNNSTDFPGFPVTVTSPIPGSGQYNYNKAPCPGDPMKDLQIAPTKRGVQGGLYGFTRLKANGEAKFHDGIDIASPKGANLYSMYQGVVVDVRNSFAPGEYLKDSYGNYVTIQSTVNGNTIYLKYNHLDGVSSNVSIGTTVSQGQYLGITGTTGNAASPGVIPHVHIQAKDQNQGKIDPQPYFKTQFDSNGKGNNPC